MHGLLYLHTHGTLYIDLRPINILVNEHGSLKLGDFGLAKRIIDLTQGDKESRKGNPYYMAPELFQDDGVCSFYSDFWAFGCVLFEMATGHPPFIANSVQELITQICNANTPNVPEFSEDFNELLIDLMEKDPAKRVTWEELVAHPFWGNNATDLDVVMPPQPQYEKYLQKRGVRQRAPSSACSTPKPAVDVLRISQNVQRNLLRDALRGGYSEEDHSVQGRPSDVKLNNRNQVLDFGEKPEDDEEDQYLDSEVNESLDESTGVELNIYEEDKVPSKKFTIPTTPRAEDPPKMQTSKLRTKSTLNDREEEEERKGTHTRSNSAHNIQPATPITKSLRYPPLEQLIFHSSDTAVKPIIGNRDIEKPHELTFNNQNLGFAPWGVEELLNCMNTSRFEGHINEVFNQIGKSSSSADKINVLSYFESLLVNSGLANRFINSAFTGLFLKIIRSVKSSPIKIRCCSIIGQMIRHATLIETEIISTGLMTILCEQLKDRNEKVRRTAMAALGEFLFYAATQMDEEQYDRVWEIPSTVIGIVYRSLRSSEDEVVRLYATKTIENITAQCKAAGLKFVSGSSSQISEVSTVLYNMMLSSRNEALRSSAAVTLCHFVRIQSSMVNSIIEKMTSANITVLMSDGQARLQQAILTILLVGFQKNPRLAVSLYEEKSLLGCLTGLLENNSLVVRGKAMLVMLHLFKQHPRWLLHAAEYKLFHILDRLPKDSKQYIYSCSYYLSETLVELTSVTVRNMTDEIQTDRKPSLILLPAVLQLTQSHYIKNKLPYAILLKSMAIIILKSTDLTDEDKENVLNVVENLAANTKAMSSFAEPVVTSLLPALLQQLSSEDISFRLHCLKIFTEIMNPFLYDDVIYDPASPHNPTTKMLNELIIKQFFPLLPTILADQNPIPLFALKQLSSILECCPPYTGILKRSGVLPTIMEYFSAGHPKLNPNLIQVVKKVLECKDLTLEEMRNYNVVEKINSVMRVGVTEDWCVEPMLDIIYELLFQTAEQVRSKKSPTENSILGEEYSYEAALQFTQPLLKSFTLCVELLSHSDSNIEDKSSHCVALMLQLYGKSLLRLSHEQDSSAEAISK